MRVSSRSKDPDEGKPAGDGVPDSPFMKDFQQMIESYAEKASAGKTEEADAIALRFVMMAGEEALKNPTPDLLLKRKAEDLEQAGDWAGAEAARREVLALEEASGNFGLVAKAQLDLSRLLLAVGRLEEAWEAACAATASARRTEVFPLLAMVLESECFCALARTDLPRALAAADEQVRIIEPGKLWDRMRAKALATRARCRLASDDQAGAESDLAACWALLQLEATSRIARSPIVTLANWWEVKSELAERQGDRSAAWQAIHRAIDYRRQLNGPFALATLARALLRLGKLAGAEGDAAAADAALSEAKTIRENLDLPSPGCS
jgi:hypothetical protein